MRKAAGIDRLDGAVFDTRETTVPTLPFILHQVWLDIPIGSSPSYHEECNLYFEAFRL